MKRQHLLFLTFLLMSLRVFSTSINPVEVVFNEQSLSKFSYIKVGKNSDKPLRERMMRRKILGLSGKIRMKNSTLS